MKDRQHWRCQMREKKGMPSSFIWTQKRKLLREDDDRERVCPCWIHLAMASSVSIGWNCRSCCQSISCCCSGAQPDGNMAMMKKCAATMGNKMANVKQQSQSLSNHAKLEKARREDDILTGDLSLLWCKQKYLSIYAIVQWENFSVLILFAFFSTPTLNMDDIFSCNTAHCTLY